MQSYNIELALISLLHTGNEHTPTVKPAHGYFELNIDRSVLMYIEASVGLSFHFSTGLQDYSL